MADISTTLDNIISHWELEESSGTRVDSHGSNDLTDNNTVGVATGKQGNGADFEASNSETLTISDASQTGLDLNSDFSVSLWFKLESLSGTNMGLVGKYNSTGDKRAYAIYITASNELWCYLTSTGTTTGGRRLGTVASFVSAGDIGSWIHLVACFDYSAESWTVYKNGSSQTVTPNDAGTFTGIQNNDQDFIVGKNNISGTEYYDGVIDEITITSDIITSGEVTTIYNGGSGIPYSGGTTVSPNALVLTASIPATSVSGQASVSVGVQTITATTPTVTIAAGWTVSVGAQVATFTLQMPLVSAGGVIFPASVQQLTFSIPAAVVAAGATLSPDAQALTFSLPASSVTADWTVSVNPVTLTASVPTLAFVGALWSRGGRNIGDWTRTAKNNT